MNEHRTQPALQPEALGGSRAVMLDAPEHTDAFGTRLAEALEPGLAVGLVGELGAGKTRLVRSVATALGANPEAVHSPTFLLIQEYAARLPLYHFDAWRLRDADEFLEIGPDEYFRPDAVCLVEWADRIAAALPEDILWIELEILGETRRQADLHAEGPRAERVRRRLMSAGEST